jgi:hypothetical protein
LARSLGKRGNGCKWKVEAGSTFSGMAFKFYFVRAAFKEWSVIVDALGRGAQILILRKGGISEGRGGFKMDHEKFLLFPTLFHQQREAVIPTAQARYDLIAPHFPPTDRLRLEYFAEVVDAKQIFSLGELNNLRGQHVWRDEVISERFDWGREKAIFALAVRVFRLPVAIELPMLPAYGGCKSWIELEPEIGTEGSTRVLTDAEFGGKLNLLRDVWGTPAQIKEAAV